MNRMQRPPAEKEVDWTACSVHCVPLPLSLHPAKGHVQPLNCGAFQLSVVAFPKVHSDLYHLSYCINTVPVQTEVVVVVAAEDDGWGVVVGLPAALLMCHTCVKAWEGWELGRGWGWGVIFTFVTSSPLHMAHVTSPQSLATGVICSVCAFCLPVRLFQRT